VYVFTGSLLSLIIGFVQTPRNSIGTTAE